MARRLAAARLIVASHNAGKAREIAALLGPLGIEAVGAAALGLAEPEETGDTFGANAALKARAAAAASGGPALADDSGLVVPALDGAPGTASPPTIPQLTAATWSVSGTLSMTLRATRPSSATWSAT